MGWFDSNFTYSSGDTPKFKVGDHVYKTVIILPTLNKKLQKFCVAHEIKGVSAKKSGLFFKEFTYTVKSLETGEIIDNVYESELYTEWYDFKFPKDPNIDLEEVIEQLYEDYI